MERVGAWKRRLLPRAAPQFPGWEWAVHYSQNGWPGGDYFDFLPIDKDRWLVFLGDASGHGGAAAVMVGMARTVLHACPLSSGQERSPFCPLHGLTQTPPIILSRLNSVLTDNSLDEQFMTAFLGFWKPEQARLDYVVAGHALPRFWQAASEEIRPIDNCAGLPLGIAPRETYSPAHVHFAPGDALLAYTDGLVEARNAHREMFGIERIDRAIRQHARDGAEAIKEGLLADLQEFRCGIPPEDDVTFLVLKRW
jgi:sigma-B regulation protein RsbU (phosphoserine phosphatase)